MRTKREWFGKPYVFWRSPQILPTKVSAAEFALVLSVMPRAIVATAFWIAVIHVCVKSFASRIAVLFVSHGAKRHPTHNGSAMPLVFACLLTTQDGVIFLSTHFGALKSDQFVVFGVFNNHATAYYAFT